jgi:GNAT superfamily N-acetyltransferase
MRWQIRSFAPAADRQRVERLWAAAMPPAWPLLPAAIARLGAGLVAEAEPGPVGFVAVDMAGSVPLILVSPAYQRRGIGTALLAAALDWLRADGATGVTAGSGGRFYIWPGVPRDLPGAVRFFTSRGWQHSHDTLDLVTDLTRYRPPPGAYTHAASKGITITQPGSTELADVLAFEAATFPSWTRWFTQSGPQNVLIARDDAGHIAGTLLLARPRCRYRIRAHPWPHRRDHRMRRRGGAQARRGNRHRPGRPRLRNPAGRRHPQLPHWLDNPRILLPPRRLPALAALCHVLQTRLTASAYLQPPARTNPIRSPLCSRPEPIRANNRAFCTRRLPPSRIPN